jgi:hypothetical protein
LNLFRVGAFLNCGLNLFHDLIVEGKKEFANNCNLVNGFLNSVWCSLNADLFRVHLANDPGCICGCAFEDAIHYILECCLYNEAREELKLRLVFLNDIVFGYRLFIF